MIATIICSILITASVVTSFRSSTYGSPLGFLALCTAGIVPEISMPLPTYIFWGVATIIVIALGYVLPPAISGSRLGLSYIAGGASVGAVIGLAIGSEAAIIIASVAGSALGGVAFGRTPRGRILDFPTSRFFNYLCAKGLPSAVAMSLNGIAAAIIIASMH